MSKTLSDVMQGLKNSSGQDFFNQIVLNFSSALDIEYVFIAELDQKKGISSTIALAAHGEIVENFIYKLKDTPCNDVADNNVCTYEKDITSLFPNDQLLIDMKIEAYVGAPLYDSKGKVLGLCVALNSKPITHTQRITTLFEIFAGRIAVEMERTKQEEALLTANKKLNNQLNRIQSQDKRIKLFYEAMQNSSEAMIITDKENRIIQVNKAFEKVYGLSSETVLNLDPKILSSHQEGHDIYKDLWECIQKTGKWKGKILNQNSKGEIIPFLASITAIQNEQNETENYLAIYNDLREKTKSEAIIRQQTKMASMGEMLGSITHQWKQPISVIQSIFLNLEVQEELNDIKTHDYKRHLENIQKQVNHMTQTMNDFKNFFQPDKETKLFLLENGIKEVYDLFGERYRIEGLSLNFKSNENPLVCGFYNEYKQVIINVINNAIDAYKEKNIAKKTLDLEIRKDQDFGYIKIQDYAGGIPLPIIEKIFEPYLTTKSLNGGTGLGLYMSKQIMANMKGDINVSNTDSGAEFTIKIPLS